MRGPTKVSEDEYLDATNNYLGWCSNCCQFTRDETEPDAEGYDCPVCGEDSVMGAEQAMICGDIDIEDEN